MYIKQILFVIEGLVQVLGGECVGAQINFFIIDYCQSSTWVGG